MQILILDLPDYEDKIISDPLVLLERILLTMHTPMRDTYPMINLTDVMSRLVNQRLKEKNYIID